jgi:hypothetical protein
LGWDVLDDEKKQEFLGHLAQYDLPSRCADLLEWFSASGMELIWAERGHEKHRFFVWRKIRSYDFNIIFINIHFLLL